jgi:chitodextrinase
VSSTALTVTWSPSADDVAVAGYRIYRNGTQVATTTAPSYNDSKLTASTTYTYTVAAYDTSGNVSAPSNQLLVTTTAPAAMPPSFVQISHNQISSGTSTPVNFSIATRPGNTIVVYVIWNNTGAAAVTDSAGNPFTAVTAPVSWGAGYSAQVFYATNIIGGSDTVTASFQTPVTNFGVVYAHEYSGIDPNNPVDVTVAASGSSATMNSGSATTTSANDLIFGAGVSDNNVNAAGSGFISRDLAYGNITEDRTAATIGSYAATATHNGQKWGMQMVAFRAAQ